MHHEDTKGTKKSRKEADEKIVAIPNPRTQGNDQRREAA